MWFFHYSPNNLRGLSGSLELPMVALPYCSGLVVVFLPESSSDASPLRVDFVARTSASAYSWM